MNKAMRHIDSLNETMVLLTRTATNHGDCHEHDRVCIWSFCDNFILNIFFCS